MWMRAVACSTIYQWWEERDECEITRRRHLGMEWLTRVWKGEARECTIEKKVRVNGGGGQRHNGGGMFRMKLVGDGRGTRLSRWTGGEAGGEMSRRRRWGETQKYESEGFPSKANRDVRSLFVYRRTKKRRIAIEIVTEMDEKKWTDEESSSGIEWKTSRGRIVVDFSSLDLNRLQSLDRATMVTGIFNPSLQNPPLVACFPSGVPSENAAKSFAHFRWNANEFHFPRSVHAKTLANDLGLEGEENGKEQSIKVYSHVSTYSPLPRISA